MSLVLPDLFPVDPWTTTTYDLLYEYFCTQLRDAPPTYANKFVVIPNQSADGLREDIFWHLTSKTDHENRRLPDPQRAARLPWVKPTLEFPQGEDVRTWFENDGRKDKVLVWLPDHDYLVVLVKSKNRHILITAFPVEHDSYRRKLEKKWKRA